MAVRDTSLMENRHPWMARLLPSTIKEIKRRAKAESLSQSQVVDRAIKQSPGGPVIIGRDVVTGKLVHSS